MTPLEEGEFLETLRTQILRRKLTLTIPIGITVRSTSKTMADFELVHGADVPEHANRR